MSFPVFPELSVMSVSVVFRSFMILASPLALPVVIEPPEPPEPPPPPLPPITVPPPAVFELLLLAVPPMPPDAPVPPCEVFPPVFAETVTEFDTEDVPLLVTVIPPANAAGAAEATKPAIASAEVNLPM